MKVLVISDSHGAFEQLERILAARPDAQALLFCGDGCEEVELLGDLHPEIVYAAVAGNCDRTSTLPGERLLEFAGVKLFLTHGHGYDVKRQLHSLARRVRELGADVGLFGHTHRPFACAVDEVLLANPGSCHDAPRYLLLELAEGKVQTLRLCRAD